MLPNLQQFLSLLVCGIQLWGGVVARVSAVCAELNINIEDITQSILQDMFCMIMLVDISACASEPAEIRARFDTLGQEMGMQVTVTRQEVFDAMHKV